MKKEKQNLNKRIIMKKLNKEDNVTNVWYDVNTCSVLNISTKKYEITFVPIKNLSILFIKMIFIM